MKDDQGNNNGPEGLTLPQREDKGFDRRSFLKTGLSGGAAILLGSGVVIERKAWASTIMVPDGRKLVLTKGVVVADKNLCSGCRTCEAVCSTANNSGQNNPELVRLYVLKNYLTCEYTPLTCHHYSDPICLQECPAKAIYVDEAHGTNARVIDESKCLGCETCIEACEDRYGNPRPRFNPAKEVCIKCHLCYGEPECVKHCPLGALKIIRSETGILTGLPFVKET